VTIEANGQLLVRVNVNQDDILEGTENLTLVATNSGGQSFEGDSTINDEGIGEIFLEDNTSPIPNQPGDPGFPVQLDDDRVLGVTGSTVNEASPYVLWSVAGAANQTVLLSLGKAGDTATPGADTGTQLQVLVGNQWLNYDANNPPQIPAGGQLLVRLNVLQDDVFEGSESLTLRASNGGGAIFDGTSFINDDGTGDIFPDNTTGAPDPNAAKDDDRVFPRPAVRRGSRRHPEPKPQIRAILDPATDSANSNR
jgi:hypothetical protein